jgi:hypothetical protein
VHEVSAEKRPRGRPPSIKREPSIAPVLIQAKNFTVTKVPIRKTIIKRDRFYDRSRDIPNDVYFGDVNGTFSYFIFLWKLLFYLQYHYTFFTQDGILMQILMTIGDVIELHRQNHIQVPAPCRVQANFIST